MQRRKSQAAAARNLIEVEYEDLPAVLDAEAAMQPDSPRVHAEIGDSNICVHYKIRKGDIEAGFEQADVIVEGEYRTPVQEHAYLQPEAGLAYIDEDGHITVKAAVNGHMPTVSKLPMRSACRMKKCASFTRPSAARSAGAKICPCRSCWRWQPGNWNARCASSGAARNPSSGMASDMPP